MKAKQIIISTKGAIGKVVPEGRRDPIPYLRVADMRKGAGGKPPRRSGNAG